MSNMYMQNILDHYHDPENAGVIQNADVVQEEYNPFCGDKITVYAIIDGEYLKDLKFSGEGCAISQASMSMLSEKIIGLKLDEIMQISSDDILEMMGIEMSPTRMKCALLGWQAIQNAIGTK